MTTQHESLKGLRVLVVEDDFDVAEAMRAELESGGCHVVGPVSTVEEACDLVKTQALDAAVLDIALSPGTSAPVARTLLYRGCPFVFVTGFSNVDIRNCINDNALDLGPAGFDRELPLSAG